MRHTRFALTALLFGVFITTALAKRIAPREVAPVSHEGIEYYAPLDVNMIGRIQARDPATKKVLWEQVIFKITYDSELERDVQWVFISNLRIDDGMLIITDERNRRYSMNPETREVRRIEG